MKPCGSCLRYRTTREHARRGRLCWVCWPDDEEFPALVQSDYGPSEELLVRDGVIDEDPAVIEA